MLLVLGVGCGFHHDPSSPEIEQGKDEHPYQIDEVPIEAHDLDDLVAALAAGEEAPPAAVEVATEDLARDDQQEDHADRHMGAMEARDHEEGRAELRCAPRVGPGPDPLRDQLGPLERLHPDEGGAEDRGEQHEGGAARAVAAIAEIDRHRHRSAAADQDEGHDRDQDQRDRRAADGQREHLARVRPRHGRRHADRHVGEQETTEDEGVAEEEDPHHGLPPGHVLERALVGRPVRDDPGQSGRMGERRSRRRRCGLCHLLPVSSSDAEAARRAPTIPTKGNASRRRTARCSGAPGPDRCSH